MAQQSPLLSDYYTPTQLANELRVTKRTLSRWEAHRIGPPRIKVGRQILFRRESVDAWLEPREKLKKLRPISTTSIREEHVYGSKNDEGY